MKTIKRLELIGRGREQVQDFYNSLNDMVTKWQNEGLEVEIQYQNSGDGFSALVIGRVNEIPHDCGRQADHEN